MNANDVIESYITDVAVRLPRKQRNDVAFELRALLTEELQAKAEASGRAADAAMATELVQAFGRPADVAARYRPTLTIIDPADGRNFLRATVIGLAIIWSLGLLESLLGLLESLRQPIGSGGGLLTALGHWWGHWWGATVIPSMWWPGVLVVGYGLASWSRRRSPRASEWKPRDGDQIQGGRAAMAMGIVGMVCGYSLLLNPHWVLDFFWNGQAAPAAYEALTYTDTFRQHQGLWLLAIVLLNVSLYLAVLVNGRWSPLLRRIENVLSLVTCAVLVWTVLSGPVFMAPASDGMFKFIVTLIVAFTLLYMGIKLHRSVRPTPAKSA